MSPNTGGNYKIQRSKYLGIYKNKTVPCIAKVIARISFHKITSDGYVWWRNDHNIKKSELVKLAKDEIERRLDFDYPVQVIVTEGYVETNFKKTSPRGMLQNNRVFDITNVKKENVSELATILEGMSWEDIND
jgi:hypothetical protein